MPFNAGRALFFGACVLVFTASGAAAQPTVAQFKQTLDAQLQNLKPTGVTVRTVLFEDVKPGKPAGDRHPFLVTAVIHDYSPGYPPNGFFGETCVGRMEGWAFDMRTDDFGRWLVQGRMTVSNSVCTKNPSAGVSATPVAGLRGAPAPKATPADAKPAAPAPSAAGTLYIGEYACYGTGGRLMTGMGFRLKSDGKYTDLDSQRAGAYVYDAAKATVTFRGGFLDGQIGKKVRAAGFDLSATVNCEPWR